MFKSTIVIAAAIALLSTTGIASAKAGGGFAVVNTSGKLTDSYDVEQLNHMGTGVFKVTFSSSVGGCANVATLGDSGTAGTFGFIEVSNSENSSDVTVSEFNSVTTQP